RLIDGVLGRLMVGIPEGLVGLLAGRGVLRRGLGRVLARRRGGGGGRCGLLGCGSRRCGLLRRRLGCGRTLGPGLGGRGPPGGGGAGWGGEWGGGEGVGAWAALSLGAAGEALVTALSADWVAVSARRSPPQAASNTTAVSVADSVLVIVVLSLVVWPFPAGLV